MDEPKVSSAVPSLGRATSIPEDLETASDKNHDLPDVSPAFDLSDSMSSILKSANVDPERQSNPPESSPASGSANPRFFEPVVMTKSANPEDLLDSKTVEDNPQGPLLKGPEDDPAKVDLPNPGFGLGDWFRKIVSILVEPKVLFRALACVILLGFLYVVADWQDYLRNLDDNMLIAFFGYVVTLVVSAILLGFALLISTAFATQQINYDLDETPNNERWQDALPEAMISKFIWLGVGVWAGILPGAFVGTLFMLTTGSGIGMYLLMIISGMALSPLFVLSATFNEYPYYIFSKESFETVPSHRFRWLRFYGASALVFVALALLCWILYLNLFIVSFVVALVTVALGLVYLKMFSIHLGELLPYMNAKKHQGNS